MLWRIVIIVTLVTWSVASPSAADGGDVVPEGTDGVAVATAGASGIEFLDPDGKTVTALTAHASDGAPVWSSGGNRLAFVSVRDGTAALFVRSSAGVMRIATLANLEWAWSPDGRWITWVSHSTWKDLWVTDVATGVSTNLTGGAREVWNPTWSPDSTLIAFESLNEEGWKDIFAIPRDGGPAVNLTGGSTGNDLHPVWSVDGTEIAFSSQRDGASAIYLVGADGANPTVLVEAPVVESCGNVLLTPDSWSPDGSRLGYSARVACGSPIGHGVRFYVADRATGTPVLLGSGSGYGASGPTWSPTGDRLAFVTGGFSSEDLTIVDTDGRNRVEVGSYFPTRVCTSHPTWSPDGSRLAFTMQESCTPMRETPSSVYVSDGHTAPSLIVAGSDPAWRPATAHVGLVDPSTGQWHLRGHPPFYYGDPGDIPFAGDWDCDGEDTAGLYRKSDAFVYLRNSNTPGLADVRFFFGNPDDVPLAGDFSGDGCDTVSLYRPSEQRFYIINSLATNGGSLGPADYSFGFGNPGDQPVVGDWDGDGIDEVGLHRESTGYFYFRISLTTGIADGEFYFGDPGDLFVSGDWGVVDGVETPAVFRPDDATFYLRHTNTQGVADARLIFGESDWLALAGRFEPG